VTTVLETRDQRLAVRLTAWQKDTIERAAALAGGSVTEFSLRALIDRAEDVLAGQGVFVIDQAAWDEFVALLDQPPAPNAGLIDLLDNPTVFDR